MVFSSIIFLFFFLPVVLVLYYTVCAPSVAMRNGLLLLTSLFFYAWGEPKNVLLLIGSCVLNWGIALAISRWRRYGKLLLVLDCAANLGVLFVFKYLGFAVTNLKAVLGDSFLPQVDIALPIGISFFTFQALSYVIDVYRDTVRVQKNPFYVALYIALFPQLVGAYRTVQHRRGRDPKPGSQLGTAERGSLQIRSGPGKKAAFGQYVCGGGG